MELLAVAMSAMAGMQGPGGQGIRAAQVETVGQVETEVTAAQSPFQCRTAVCKEYPQAYQAGQVEAVEAAAMAAPADTAGRQGVPGLQVRQPAATQDQVAS